ncbi:MAG: HAD family hydrolase [Clostridia bacterium]|nr:HAD family hydrolase [Clostridia bacterium]
MRFTDYIFDLYGTLADVCTNEAPAVFWEGAASDAESYGAHYTGEALRRDYLRLCVDEVRLRALTLPDVPEAFIEPELLNVFKRLLSEHGADEARAEAFALSFRRRSTLWLKPMPHALETLDALRKSGARTFLLSNAQSCFTVRELDALHLTHRFDGILLSSDAGMKKPYRGLYELLLSRYGIGRKTAVMVGNDAVADIGGADAVGLMSFYYHTWQSGAHPDALPSSCREIPDLSALLT